MKDYSPLENELGHSFSDRSLLEKALTHSSATADKAQDNERMEFLGDAVLDLVIREYLYHTYPTRREGELTEVKSVVVRKNSLAKAGRALKLRPFLQLGRGIDKHSQLPASVFANAFEALVAALWLDGGYKPARHFIIKSLKESLDGAIDNACRSNYKSLYQQFLQQTGPCNPEYRQISAEGPDHNKFFIMAVYVDDEEKGRGTGANKKAAEQEAARQALILCGELK